MNVYLYLCNMTSNICVQHQWKVMPLSMENQLLRGLTPPLEFAIETNGGHHISKCTSIASHKFQPAVSLHNICRAKVVLHYFYLEKKVDHEVWKDLTRWKCSRILGARGVRHWTTRIKKIPPCRFRTNAGRDATEINQQ